MHQRERRLALDVPLLVLSASREAAEHVRALEAHEGIAKPFDQDELLGGAAQALTDRDLNKRAIEFISRTARLVP